MRVCWVYFILSVAVTAISCSQQAVPVTAETILQPSKGGDFRGVRIGDKPKSIKKNEEASSVYSMPDELIFRFNPGEADSTWYEISYNFNQDGLNHISLDVFPESEELREHLYNDFITYYNQRYGNHKTMPRHIEWRGLTEQGKFIAISLLKEQQLNNRQHLRLVFNESNQ